MPQLLYLAYQLRAHRFGDWALDRWGATLAWGASAVVVGQWLLRGRPALPIWHWLILGLLLAGGIGLLALRGWAAKRAYVVFAVDTQTSKPHPHALPPEDKVALRATGRFEVEGKTGLFADLLAYWRSFGSREHAVMAILHPHRFLGLGRIPDERLGMWYIFIQPDALIEVTPGQLTFGRQTRPALRVVHRYTPPRPEGKKAHPPVRETVYLAFEAIGARAAVWADLMADDSSAG